MLGARHGGRPGRPNRRDMSLEAQAAPRLPVRGPGFLVIGAQKAGTRALYAYLAQHPVIGPAKKEIGFFDQDVVYRRGTDWYANQFRTDGDVLTFDATPEYIYYPQAAARIFTYDPNLKLIALLREPVSRAWSAWNMFRSLCDHEPDYIRSLLPECDAHVQRSFQKMLDRYPTFEEAIDAELEAIAENRADPEPGFVQRGLYAQQLQRYLRYFAPQQLLVVKSEEMRTHTRSVLARVLEFLQLPEHTWPEDAVRPVAVGDYAEVIPSSTEARLRAFYAPHNAALSEIVGREFNW
jgi:hypothetical protein